MRVWGQKRHDIPRHRSAQPQIAGTSQLFGLSPRRRHSCRRTEPCGPLESTSGSIYTTIVELGTKNPSRTLILPLKYSTFIGRIYGTLESVCVLARPTSISEAEHSLASGSVHNKKSQCRVHAYTLVSLGLFILFLQNPTEYYSY